MSKEQKKNTGLMFSTEKNLKWFLTLKSDLERQIF